MNMPVKRGTARRLGLTRATLRRPTGWVNPYLTPWPENWTPYNNSFITTEAQPFAVTPCARCGHLASDHHKLHCEALDCDCSGGFLTP